jgi:hypothetical protein
MKVKPYNTVTILPFLPYCNLNWICKKI